MRPITPIHLPFYPTLYSGLLGNDYLWSILRDATDSTNNQVDTVSIESPLVVDWGSVWPLVAGFVMTNQSVPVAFIPCAKGGASISEWQPSGVHTNRSSLYGSSVWRSKYFTSGGVKAVVMWEGEADAIAGTSQATFYNGLTNYTANTFADLGAKVVVCKFQHCTGISDGNQNAINAAIGQAWASDSNTITGPDLTDLVSDDDYHLKTDANVQTAASRWWDSIQTAFY